MPGVICGEWVSSFKLVQPARPECCNRICKVGKVITHAVLPEVQQLLCRCILGSLSGSEHVLLIPTGRSKEKEVPL